MSLKADQRQILEALADAWQRYPDQRLGQIVYNFCRPAPPCPAVFSITDKQLLHRLSDPQGLKQPGIVGPAEVTDAGFQFVGVEPTSGEAELRLSVGGSEGTVFVSREFWDEITRRWDKERQT